MKISIIIPALNEAQTIGMVVEKAKRAINNLGIEGEIIVVDNGSTDDTGAIAQQSGARVIQESKKGYGSALRSGFAQAQGQYILMADADDSYNLEEIAPFINQLDEGYDFVIGNRYKGKISAGAMPFLHRYLGTPVLTFIMNTFFSTGIGDVNCGMRAFRRDAYQQLDCRASGMEFASEMLIKASLRQMKITEVPCNLYRDKRSKKPHLNTWQDGWRHLSTICKLKLRGSP
jgi:glycosyltransferase involved in cell wall biosynthesis